MQIRKRTTGVIVGLLALAIILTVVIGGRTQTSAPKRISLKPDQEQALNAIQKDRQTLDAQYQMLKDQLDGKQDSVISGIVVSTPEVATLGFNWKTKYKVTNEDQHWYLDPLPADQPAPSAPGPK